MTQVADEDCFDCLPDVLLLHIFNKVSDIKSLTRCLSVSKRFASLIPQTDTLFISFPPSNRPNSKLRAKNLLKILVSKFISKPLHFFHHVIAPKSASNPDHNVSYCLPNEVLKHFKEVKSMRIELPSRDGKIGLENGDSLLKWKAEFGGELKSCVILGATSFQRSMVLSDNSCETSGQVVLADDELKLRVVWIISCLIAASSRHYLLKKILAEHVNHTLQDVTISDVNKQGKLCMDKDQIVEMRNSMKPSLVTTVESCLERTQVPELSMKVWYVPVLALPATGYLMKGATLIVIRPIVDGVIGKGSDGDDLFGFSGKDKHEEKAFDEAVREMMKMKKSYVMTMNSF